MTKKFHYFILIVLLLWPAVVQPAHAQDPCFDVSSSYFQQNFEVHLAHNTTNYPNIPFYSSGYVAASGNREVTRAFVRTKTPLTIFRITFDISANGNNSNYFYFGQNSQSSYNLNWTGGAGSVSATRVITTSYPGQAVHYNFVTEAVSAAPASGQTMTIQNINICTSNPNPTPTPTPTTGPTPTPTTPTPSPTPQPQTCDLVDNADFATDDTWLLQGATIQSGTLTLPPGGIAAQNLSGLQGYTTYNAVIEVDQVSGGQTALNVVLGPNSSTLLIDQAGSYNTTFTTPDLNGPLAFGVENAGGGTLTISFICLSLDTSNGQHACLAPSNGEFTTASGWDFYRGSSWSSLSENVLLPAEGQGLLIDPASYALPDLDPDQYLIMAYEARKVNGEQGQIASAAIASPNDSTQYFEVFGNTYTFESNISQLAGLTLSQLAFANNSDDQFTADVVLDNVCIYVSDEPPKLPYPTDPNQITNPVTGGNGISSCDDVDGIWASFGVNMAQYRASYAAGASVWEPGGWVPWLVAAVFVTLSDWSCMFMAAYLSILQTIAHLINNILNIWQWIETTGIAFFAWLGEWGMWAWLSGANITGEFGSTAADWIEWINDIFIDFPLWLILFPNAIGTWIGYHLLLVFYEFVGGWNALMGLLAAIYGLLIDPETDQIDPETFALIDQFVPGGSYLALVIWAASELAYLFVDLVWSVGQMIFYFLAWLWENVITLGHIPINFYYAFNDGTEATSFGSLISCTSGEGAPFWCGFLAGVELVNRTISHTILYPIVIIGIVVTTLAILWRNIDDLFYTYTS